MSVLYPWTLFVLIASVFLRHADRIWHLLHRSCFGGLRFYLPPSDQEVLGATAASAAEKNIRAHSSDVRSRKRKSKKAVAAADAARLLAESQQHVDLDSAKISGPIYVQAAGVDPTAGAGHFETLRGFVGINLCLLLLVISEQLWMCAQNARASAGVDAAAAHAETHDNNDVLSREGGGGGGGGATPSTAILLVFVLLYNLWSGVSMLRRIDSSNLIVGDGSQGSRYWMRRIALFLGFISVMFALFIQSQSPSTALTQEFIHSGHAESFHTFTNDVAFASLKSLHTILDRSKEHLLNSSSRWLTNNQDPTSSSRSIDALRSYLPPLPPSPGDLSMDAWISFHGFRLGVALMCALLAASLFNSAWRSAKLMVDGMEQREEEWMEMEEEHAHVGKRVEFMKRMKMTLVNLMHQIAFFSPAVIIFLWLPPVSSNLWSRVYMWLFSNTSSSSTSDDLSHAAWRSFELFRFGVIIGSLLLRLFLTRSNTQAFLLSSPALLRNLNRSIGVGGGNGGLLDSAPMLLRIQTILKAVFWSAPLVTFQYLFPIAFTAAIVAAWKLAQDWTPLSDTTPDNNAQMTSCNMGWGVCFAIWGQAALPHVIQQANQLNAVADVNEIKEETETTASPSQTQTLDTDEFDGHLPEDENILLTETAAAAASPIASASSLSSSSALTPAPNILATTLGFLLWFLHFIWFLQSALCFSYLKTFRRKQTYKTGSAPALVTTVPISSGTATSTSSSSAYGSNKKKD